MPHGIKPADSMPSIDDDHDDKVDRKDDWGYDDPHHLEGVEVAVPTLFLRANL